jgi:hypothetical protein
MSSVEPVVTGPQTRFAGRYKILSRPQGLASRNLMSWKIIEAILDAYGTADFWDLSVAVRGHKFETKKVKGPQSFIRYCIRNGWLEKA